MAVAPSVFAPQGCQKSWSRAAHTGHTEPRNPLGSLGHIQLSLGLVAGVSQFVPLQPQGCIPACSPAPWQLNGREG